jgi:hypothetical protein
VNRDASERAFAFRVASKPKNPIARRKPARLIAEGDVSREDAQRPEAFAEVAAREGSNA